MDITSFLWAVLLAIAAFGGGSAYGVLGMNPARYRDAKILFWISGLAIGAIAIMFGLTVPISAVGRMAGTGIIGALAAIVIVESMRWVENIQTAATPTVNTLANILVLSAERPFVQFRPTVDFTRVPIEVAGWMFQLPVVITNKSATDKLSLEISLRLSMKSEWPTTEFVLRDMADTTARVLLEESIS